MYYILLIICFKYACSLRSGFYETPKQRMRPVGPALKLRMELDPYKKVVRIDLHRFDQFPVRRTAAASLKASR